MDSLSLLIFMPFLTGLLLLALPVQAAMARNIGLLVALFSLLLGLNLLVQFEPVGSMQFDVIMPWITSYGIVYHVGLDGLSLPILLATLLLMPALYASLWHVNRKGYWANLLILQGGVTGTLLAQDLILFYLFWEMMLLPIFFMIGMYGSGNRRHTAVKVTLYTMLGSFLMLVSILYMGFSHFEQFGFWSFSPADMQHVALADNTFFWLFVGFLAAFAIKIPLFPFHTWLPVTYADAPAGTVVLLSSIMAKLGVYALLRFVFPIFPELVGQYAGWFVAGGIVGLLFFGIAALMQNDLKRLLAYSSGSHLSLIVIGIFSLSLIGLQGSLYLILAHALATGGLFLMVDHIEHHTKSRQINQLGALASAAPVFTLIFAIFMLTVIGMPGTSGFVSELLIIFGSFEKATLPGVLTASSVILGVSFMLWMFGRVMLGRAHHKETTMPDLSKKALLALAPLALLLVVMGVYPQPLMELTEPSAVQALDLILGGSR